ncbi:hypothetical protein GCM10023321_04020 [Pseudonocardia eucalypti]|uniref:HTH tetR-type domain-containing protein n=1 Tax=Pseudonocardia eucalypti TaxID=648755 RepID=A0ABP9PJ14_9PSEU|nr:AcrR family transcriptional regulator [Pseudonocardia eucalypti]
MPAPRRFTPEALRDAALAIVDADGLDALTMRALAGRLGTGAMTIYNYVDGRDGLNALVAAAVLADAPAFPPTGRADWAGEVRSLAEWLWRAVRAHPNAIPLLLNRRTTDESTMAYAEALLGALRRSGRSGFALLAAFRAVTGFVTGFAQARLVAEGDPDPALAHALTLPAERYPGLREIAEATTATTRDAEFTAALDLILTALRVSTPDSVGSAQ